MSSLPSIQTLNSQKPAKSISFEVANGERKRGKLLLSDDKGKLSKDLSHIGVHSNRLVKDKTTKSFEEMTGNLNNNNEEKLDKLQKGFASQSVMHRDMDQFAVYGETVQKSQNDSASSNVVARSKDVNIQLSKMLREKDREISKLREKMRKTTLDRENASCADAQSRMRVVELKNKLSSQQRHVDHMTTVERLRCKEKVSNETERLRHERDDAREQLEHSQKLILQLRKEVEQLGYLSRQRYKTIQELGKKMATKDKNIQEMRKRMEQAQLIAIPGTGVERRNSVSRNLTWETPSRLAVVNE